MSTVQTNLLESKSEELTMLSRSEGRVPESDREEREKLSRKREEFRPMEREDSHRKHRGQNGHK